MTAARGVALPVVPSRRVPMLLAVIALAGCAAPPDEGLAPPMGGLRPEGWYQAPGVEWGNLTGPLPAGACSGYEVRVAPPTRIAWWFVATPGANLLVKDWAFHTPDATLCATADPDEGRSARNTTRHHAVEDVRTGEGVMFALVCEAQIPCEVSIATQRIREVDGPAGSRVWASEVGPPPTAYGT